MDRLDQLRHWLAGVHEAAVVSMTPASSDASFRSYHRVSFASGETRIVMDAPPEHEDCRPWLAAAQVMRDAGVSVPRVLADDVAQGFVLMSDLGRQTYLDVLDADNAHALYADALGSLMAFQMASRDGVFPVYDQALLTRELALFPEWYVGRHKAHVLDDTERNRLKTVFERILGVNLAEPRVFVHRDYHSRNLMWLDAGNPGVLDFQDAVYGPLSYDLVSLLKDAYIDWEEDFVLDLLARYWETAKKLGLPVRDNFADFHLDFEFMGMQRHLKVLGIFARLAHRDGKTAYLDSMPRVLAYLRKCCRRYSAVAPLLPLLEKLEPEAGLVEGYSF